MSKFQLKSNKRTVVRIYLKRIGLSFFWLYLPVLLLILLGCSSTAAKKTIPEKNSEEITFYIKNSGSGPAIIKYVKFFHDEKSYSNVFKLIKDCCFDIYAYEAQLNELQKESTDINFFETFGWLYTGVSNNRLLASGAELNLFGFKKTGFNTTQWDKVNKQRMNIKTEICYCSLLEQCYLSDGRGDVKEIEQCDIAR